MRSTRTIPWVMALTAAASCSTTGTGPIALDDEIVLTAFGPTMIDVLDNDRAPIGDQLQITSTQAGAGSTSVMNGHVLYAPPPDLANDVFVYTVRASSGETSSATVTVTIRTPATTTTQPSTTTTTSTVPTTTTTSTVPTTTTTTTTSTVPTTTTTTTTTPPRPGRFEPSVIDFGEVVVGRRYERVVTVIAGGTVFEVGSADPVPNGGVGFNTDQRCGELPPGQWCEATVTFEPVEPDPEFDVTVFPGAVPSLRVIADIAVPDVAPPEWVRPRDGDIVSFTQIPDGLPVVLAPAPVHRELVVEATVCFRDDRCSNDGTSVERSSATSIERITFDQPTVVRIREALAAGVDVRIRLAATGITQSGSSNPDEATVELLVVSFAEP